MTFAPSVRPPHEKLGLGPDIRLLVLGMPPAGADRWPGRRSQGDPGSTDVVVVGCATVDDVLEHVPVGLAARRPNGRLWVAYRRGRGALSRAALGAAIDALGLDLTWHRQVALDGGWSAIWFRRRSEFRSLNH